MTKEQAQQLVDFKQQFNADVLYTLSARITIMPYNYGAALTNFIQFCYNNNLVNADYDLIKEELSLNKAKAEWFAALPEEKIIQCIGYYIRRDRFTDGLLASAVTDGTISRLLQRIKALYGL